KAWTASLADTAGVWTSAVAGVATVAAGSWGLPPQAARAVPRAAASSGKAALWVRGMRSLRWWTAGFWDAPVPSARRQARTGLPPRGSCAAGVACSGALFAPPDPQVDGLHEHREGHRRVDVALRDVLAEAVGDQHQADHDQEAQCQHLDRGVALDEIADRA